MPQFHVIHHHVVVGGEVVELLLVERAEFLLQSCIPDARCCPCFRRAIVSVPCIWV